MSVGEIAAEIGRHCSTIYPDSFLARLTLESWPLSTGDPNPTKRVSWTITSFQNGR